MFIKTGLLSPALSSSPNFVGTVAFTKGGLAQEQAIETSKMRIFENESRKNADLRGLWSTFGRLTKVHLLGKDLSDTQFSQFFPFRRYFEPVCLLVLAPGVSRSMTRG